MALKLKRGIQWLMPKSRVVGGVILLVGLLIGLVLKGGEIWTWYLGNKTPNEAIAPLLTLATGAAVAWIALMRHFATTDADRQRRITDNYSKAVDQLSSDKIETRLGGIYILERISKESPDDYWTIMETLTAFVRERARWRAPDAAARPGKRQRRGEPESQSQSDDKSAKRLRHIQVRDAPPTDIAAVLTVILRRPKKQQSREENAGWRFDLSEADLSGANLSGAYLSGAYLSGANLSDANLTGANLSKADLMSANLSGAYLIGANLSGACLYGANLRGADLSEANLRGADLHVPNLSEADLSEADLSGADLGGKPWEGWPHQPS